MVYGERTKHRHSTSNQDGAASHEMSLHVTIHEHTPHGAAPPLILLSKELNSLRICICSYSINLYMYTR